MSQTPQERPYVMDTGWERGIHGDLDGEALYRWAKRLESQESPKLLKACKEVLARLERFEMDYDSRQILKNALRAAGVK